jgi:integrase
MASIRSFPKSRYWYACFSVPTANGKLKQVQRTTKEVDRRKALEIARKLEAVARIKLTEAQAHKSIVEIYAVVNPGDTLPGSSARDWFTSWAKNKAVETSSATAARYQRTADQFIESLGKRSELDINAISVRDVVAFRDARAKRVSISTANVDLKIVRMALKDALAAGLCLTNVAVSVRPAKSSDQANARRAFTLPELQRIYRQAEGEWRGLVLFGLYTGARLGDIAALTWQNVDLDRSELKFVSRKTKRPQFVRIHPKLHEFLVGLDAGDDPKEPLFPRASAAKRTGTLSNQFYEILVDAGLAEKRKHISQEKGRDGRRRFNEISFHALRHTCTSLMKIAGVSQATVMDLVGHDSPASSSIYTHVDEASKRAAIDALPDITAE